MHGDTWEDICKMNLSIRFYPANNNKSLKVFKQEQLSHICVLARRKFRFSGIWSLYSVWSRTPIKKKNTQPGLVWLSGLSASLRTKGSLVPFLVGAHAWVPGRSPAGVAWEAATHWCFFPFLPSLLSKNKSNLFKKYPLTNAKLGSKGRQ